MKLFVSDLDGTLLNQEFQISKTNVQAIRRLSEKGVIFVVATGRIYHDALTICQNQQLSPYIIASNGACIFDQDGSQIYGRWIVYSELMEIMAYLDSIQVCYGLGNSREYITNFGWEKVMDQEVRRLSAKGTCIPDKKVAFAKHEMTAQNGFCETNLSEELKKGNLTCYSMSVVTYDEEKINKIVEFLEKYDNLTATVAGSHSMEIMRKDGTKGIAVRYLSDMLDIKRQDVAAVGDSFNDLSMLKYAKTSVAMGNAKDEIKSICTFTTLDCLENGFAYAVDKLLDREEQEIVI